MTADSPSLRDRLEFAGFKAVVLVVRLLPEWVATALGSALGWVAGAVLRIRRDVVEENLQRAFPELDGPERRRLAIRSYRHLGREAVATFRTAHESAERIRERTTTHGFEAVRAVVESGGGCILLTGHMGNWEIGGSAMAARGLPVDAVALRQRNRLFSRELVLNRERLGMHVIDRGDAAKRIPRSLAAGRIPGFVADQNAGRNGVFVDFFGVPASTARGPAVFALRAGVPLFTGAAVRVPDERGRWSPARYDIYVEELRVERTGDVAEDVRALTAAHTAALERYVRRAPEQYFWVHKRWKTRPRPVD